jgi:hypothetical protein
MVVYVGWPSWNPWPSAKIVSLLVEVNCNVKTYSFNMIGVWDLMMIISLLISIIF